MLQQVAKARRRWGKNVNPPFTPSQMMEAIELADDQGVFNPSVSPEEATKLRRQLAACENREKARRKREGEE